MKRTNKILSKFIIQSGFSTNTARGISETASIAKRLLNGGGLLLGKTKTVEVAYGPWGTNKQRGTPWNPWDIKTHRAPGGSSSGTGVSVAARLTVCGIGTDTGGSVRIPSAFCGVVGLKVTERKLPLDGIQPLSHTLDTPGPMCQNTIDAAIMYEVIANKNLNQVNIDFNSEKGVFHEMKRGIEGLVFGVLAEREREIVDSQILELYDSAVKRLQKLGGIIKPLNLPSSLDDMRFGVATIISVEGYYYHGEMYENPKNPMDEDVKARIMEGKTETASNYVRALRQRITDRDRFHSAMHGMVAYLTPTVPISVPVVDQIDQSSTPSQFTRMVNYLGFCAVSVPMGVTTDNLPGGLQIIAFENQENIVLRIGAAFERDFGDIGIPPGWD